MLRLFPAGLVPVVVSICMAWATTARPVASAELAKHVVVINIDGFAAYLLDDARAPVPTLRRLAAQGAYAVDGMRVSNPSVTWPNHTSLVTGVRPEKHGVLANGMLVRGPVGAPVVVNPACDKSELVRTSTIYDAAHKAGLTTGEINWPCTRGAKTLDDSFPDTPDAVLHSTPRLREELVAAGILADATDKTFRADSVVARDHVWTEAACHLIRKRKPNLLFIHLLNVDSTHHMQGPQSPPGYTANAYADACVARILQAIDDAGIREQTTIFLVADHGFTRTPKAIKPNLLLHQAGLLKVQLGRITEATVNVVPEGGIGLVYCNVPGNVEADRRRVKDLFAGKEGVAAVLEAEQFAEYGLPHPREYAQAPDLVIAAEDGYGVSASVEGENFTATNVEARVSLGTHGFLSTSSKMNAVCILAGCNIRPGVKLERVENIDIAPTIARLLNLDGFQADGRVLEAALLAE